MAHLKLLEPISNGWTGEPFGIKDQLDKKIGIFIFSFSGDELVYKCKE